MFGRLSVAGSIIGGIKETQELLQFCADKKVFPDCKVIEANQIDEVWDKLSGAGGAGNVDGIRYVIDIKKSLENKDFVPK
jgi:uncharacterized zinc-type alcohol dehydrogenase-like protein